MNTFTIEINEQQMELINQALLLFQSSESERQTLSDEDVEEINIMVDLVGMTKDEEAQNPGSIHGWCY